MKRYEPLTGRRSLPQLRQFILLIVAGSSVNALAAVDLTGTYDVATLTPLERPAMFGNNRFFEPRRGRKNSTR
jgi:hypothetical protein